MSIRVGIVVVHGVIPHPRYEIQDQAAQGLAAALNSRRPPAAGQTWAVDVLNPHVSAAPAGGPPIPSPPSGYETRSTISRVHLIGPAGQIPGSDVFDVIEAYWSPLDKNKTTWRSVLSWLLSTVFVPANTTARYMAPVGKTCFDIGYVLTAATLGVGFLGGALLLALDGFRQVVTLAGNATPTNAADLTALWGVFADPPAIGKFLSIQAVALLASAAVGGFTVMQAVRATISVVRQRDALDVIPVQLWSRVVFVALLYLISAVTLGIAALVPLPSGTPMGWVAVRFVLAAFAFEIGQALLQSFIVNFFGDVQIYTTHDENSEFYSLRSAILELVTKVIGDTTSSVAADGVSPYDRVHVLAHSLGSTIALDALIRLYNLTKQGGYAQGDFDRIRSFITFGSPLEKTKYFFDIANPSQSLSYVQWRNDAYGVLFANAPASLQYPNGAGEGIFWMNFSYFLDPIANRIDSYRSFLVPGDDLADASRIRAKIAAGAPNATHVAVGRSICLNREHRGIINPFTLHFIPHGDYLGDPWFWNGNPHFGVFDVIVSADAAASPSPHFARVVEPNAEGVAPHPERFELVPSSEGRWHRDRYEK